MVSSFLQAFTLLLLSICNEYNPHHMQGLQVRFHSFCHISDADVACLSLQVKLRGVRIELTEVEHHLSSFPGVKQALVVVHTDSIQQQHLVGYLSPDTIDTEQLRQHVAKFLPKQMIPETFVLLDQFPKMPNGKADRASLPEPKYSDMAKADYEAPSNEMQEAVRLPMLTHPLVVFGSKGIQM